MIKRALEIIVGIAAFVFVPYYAGVGANEITRWVDGEYSFDPDASIWVVGVIGISASFVIGVAIHGVYRYIRYGDEQKTQEETK